MEPCFNEFPNPNKANLQITVCDNVIFAIVKHLVNIELKGAVCLSLLRQVA